MEESDLMKERLHAITERHRIQEEIRRKKMELDQEKLNLQHLKKKSLREQWLLLDSASHHAPESRAQQRTVCDRQQTRELQLSIHSMEMEVESLERAESMITTNEGFILNRLRAVEKSSQDIIKEAQDSFVHEPLKVTAVVPDVPECISPTSSTYSELNPPRKTLFAMEINVTKNLLTGESTVLSAATVPTEELSRHTGLKVFDDGRKCVYALNSQERSSDKRVSELSAGEVEQLLRSASVHRQSKAPNYQRHDGRGEALHPDRHHHHHHHHQGETDGRHQRGRYGFSTNTLVDKDFGLGLQEATHRRRQEPNNLGSLHHNGHQGFGRHGDEGGRHSRLYQLSHRVKEHRPASKCNSGLGRRSGETDFGRANGYPAPVSHDQKVVYPCYTPLNDIPLRDYISVEDRELYCSDSPSSLSHHGSPATALYSSATLCHRVPSPLFGDDAPYTILNSVNTTEPITAIFMGFQTAQDDSGQVQEDFQGALKAELVVIDDHHDHHEDKKAQACPAAGAANGDVGQAAGGRWTDGGTTSAIRKMKSKHKACCAVC